MATSGVKKFKCSPYDRTAQADKVITILKAEGVLKDVTDIDGRPPISYLLCTDRPDVCDNGQGEQYDMRCVSDNRAEKEISTHRNSPPQ